MVRTNVTGTINTVRAGLGPMPTAGRGHIVVVSSGAALRAFPWAAVYVYVRPPTRGRLPRRCATSPGTGVSPSTILPGEVATDLHAEVEQLPDWRNSRTRSRPRRWPPLS